MVCEGCVQWCPGGAAGCGCSPSVAGDSSQQIGRTMVCNGAKLSPPKPSLLHHHIRYHFTYILIVTSLRLVFFTTWIVQSSLVTSEGGSFLWSVFETLHWKQDTNISTFQSFKRSPISPPSCSSSKHMFQNLYLCSNIHHRKIFLNICYHILFSNSGDTGVLQGVWL